MTTTRATRPVEPVDLSARVPPSDTDAEAACLSAALLSWQEAATISWLRPEEFYSEANRRIWEAILSISAGGVPPDVLTVAAWLRDRDRLGQVGGAPYLAQIVDAVPSVANVDAYAHIVREKARARSLISACNRTVAETYAASGAGVDELIGEHERSIFSIGDTRASRMVFVKSPTERVYNELQKAAQEGQTATGIATGFERYDKLTAGLHEGELTIIAARPGQGKTSKVLNIAHNIAVRQPDPLHDRTFRNGVVVFSLEMPLDQLVSRLLIQEGRVEAQKFRAPATLTKCDWDRISNAAGWLYSIPLMIDDTPAISVPEIRLKVRQARADLQTRGALLRLIVIDYLQLMRAGEASGNREQEIAQISRGLKKLAKDEGVPVIALAQLNRAVETRGEGKRRPMLSDLRESGAIEADADNIVFIYRDEYYDANSKEKGIAELIVAKQRNGPTKTVKTRWNAWCTRFDNLAEGEYEEEL